MNSAWVRSAPLLLLFGLGCFLPLLSAKTKSASSAAPGRDYVSALGAANRFLQAWQSQDRETGLLMLTDVAKQHSSEERLQDFFVAPGGAQRTYELGRGKRLKAGVYSFPVTLFDMGPGNQLRIHSHSSRMVVIRTGKEDWAIDKLP